MPSPEGIDVWRLSSNLDTSAPDRDSFRLGQLASLTPLFGQLDHPDLTGTVQDQSASPTAAAAPAQSAPVVPAGPPAATVPSGVPLRVALERRVAIKHVGDHIQGRLAEPIYVFDHVVLPAGKENPQAMYFLRCLGTNPEQAGRGADSSWRGL